MIEIQSHIIQNTTVKVPGSKSYTHRALIVSALSDGECEILNGLDSEDTRLTRNALRQMGIAIDEGSDSWRVQGVHGRLQPCIEPIFLGNSGTSMRLLAAVCAMGKGKYILTGTARMQERPIQDLLDGLHQIGIQTMPLGCPGCPPIQIEAGAFSGGSVSLNCGTSSQYLSALLLISPFSQNRMEIIVTEGPVSKPYIDMTIDVMTQAGVSVSREGYSRFQIDGNQRYRPGRFDVEPDISQAGYFWAAAAVTGATITVSGISQDSRQGDLQLLDVFSSMGCTIRVETDGISVTGGSLRAVEVDMGAMPDMVPTLAVVAAFAKGKTVITNVGHLKAKESDRLGSVVSELVKLGIRAGYSDTAMWIEGGYPQAARIDPHDDHRLAMSFAVAGLKVPGIRIENETCVNKSFPEFWKVFESLYS